MNIQTERDIVDALIAWHRDSSGNHRLPTLEECLKVRGSGALAPQGGSDVQTL